MPTPPRLLNSVSLVGLAVAALLVLTTCQSLPGGGGGGRKEKDVYYEGYEGVATRFAPGTPSVIYYFPPLGTVPGQPPPPPSPENRYELNIEVENQGASDAFGALFISGFDPHLMSFEEFQIPQAAADPHAWLDCGGSAVTWVQNMLRGAISCNVNDWFNFLFGRDASTTRVGVSRVDVNRILVDLIPALQGDSQELSGWARFLRDFSHVTFDIVYDSASNSVQWGLNIAGPAGITVGALDYGRGFILEIIALYQARADVDRIFALDLAKGAVALGVDKRGFMVGDRPESPGGELDIKTLHYTLQNWPTGLDKMDQYFLVTSCYLYVTHANPVICLDPFPDSPGRKVCRPGPKTYPRGQGAPVAITRIEQENTAKDVFFTIYFENRGGGMVFNPLAMEVCNPYFTDRRVTARDLDVLRIHQIRIEGDPQPISCQPISGIVRLRQGKGSIRCRYPIVYRSQSAYQTPLVVEAAYGYSSAIQRKVTIRRSG